MFPLFKKTLRMSLTNCMKLFDVRSVKNIKPDKRDIFKVVAREIEIDRVSGNKCTKLYEIDDNIYRDEIIAELIDRGFRVKKEDDHIAISWP